jgi:hypothetical protein
MALSAKTKLRLKNALTRASLADEMEAAMDSPAPLSAKLKRAIVVALAGKAAGQEVVDAIENGPISLSEKTKARIRLAMASKAAGNEVIAAIES